MKPISPSKIARLLIRGTNWIGDAVMSVPALREIRRLVPQARISLLVKPWVKDVYASVDFVDEVLEYDDREKHAGWNGLCGLARELSSQHFDAVILLQNAFKAAWIARLASIPIRIGYARDARSILLTHRCKIDPELKGVHQAYYYLGILSELGWLPPKLWTDTSYTPSIRIGVSKEARTAAQEILTDNGIKAGQIIVGLNPGASYGGAKRWPIGRFAGVADALVDRHKAQILVFGSAGERAIAEQVAATMKHPAHVLAGRTSLAELMGLLSECRLVITNDSGPMHLSAALDVPQIAIFGSTCEIATGPLGGKAQVVKNPVECNPCFLRECPIDLRCMTRISVEDVLRAAEGNLNMDSQK